MTDGMLARDALERKEAWAFLDEGVGLLLGSSAEFRERCREMLERESGRGCLEFEEDLRGAVLRGTARGLSESAVAVRSSGVEAGLLDVPVLEGAARIRWTGRWGSRGARACG